MKTPSLEEVKQKYLNAENVKCIWDDKIYDLSKWNIYYNKENNSFYGAKNKKDYMRGTNNYIGLFGKRSYARYAEIISYKDKTYQLSETFVKELCKEPNIKDAFIREGIIDETIEIKKSLILNTPNDLDLGQLIRKML